MEGSFCCLCDFGFGDFFHKYSDNVEELIRLCQEHNLILKNLKCEKCNSACLLDIKKKSFRCDKSKKLITEQCDVNTFEQYLKTPGLITLN